MALTHTVDLADHLAAALASSRARTLSLVAPYDDAILCRQHDPLMSPLVWDLAHVANYEDYWLVRALGGTPTRPGIDDLYDAFQQPRHVREALPLLSPAQARSYGDAVRSRALHRLSTADLSPDGPDPLLRHGFVHAMVVQHEHQHAETTLATIQLLPADEGHQLELPPPPPALVLPPAEVHIPAGPLLLGTDDPWAYDNERPGHVVEVPGFWIDAAPVTNAQFQAFIADDGYSSPEWWRPEGWEWAHAAGLVAPQFWVSDGDGWQRWRFGWMEPVPADEPVQHVSWYEADAYARWAGRRLPTEAEWEKAAAGASPDPQHSNLGQQWMGPTPIGAHPGGVSDHGCHQMIGDVWEWTSSDFRLYPGFQAFPYKEYSEVFDDGGFKVLRGGSWATHPRAARITFRNWDFPIRRQIFAGFRCARDDT